MKIRMLYSLETDKVVVVFKEKGTSDDSINSLMIALSRNETHLRRKKLVGNGRRA